MALAAPVARADAAPAATNDIVLFEFTPRTLEVSAGTSVTWVNQDSIVHSVTSGTPDSMDETDALFDSGLFDQNQTFTFTFTDPGVYAYRRIFPENLASLALHRKVGFREVGIYRRPGKLDGARLRDRREAPRRRGRDPARSYAEPTSAPALVHAVAASGSHPFFDQPSLLNRARILVTSNV